MYLNTKIFKSVYPYAFNGCIAFKGNPFAFNDPIMFKSLMRLTITLMRLRTYCV